MSHVVPVGVGGDGIFCAVHGNIHTHPKMKFHRGGGDIQKHFPSLTFAPSVSTSPFNLEDPEKKKKEKKNNMKLGSLAQNQPLTVHFEKKNFYCF